MMNNAPHVLIAENDSVARASLEKTAQSLGYQVTAVRDGADALEMYAQERFDLVLSDLMLPRMGGHALAQAIRAENSVIPIVMTSAEGNIDDVVELLRVGVNDYLQKPIRPDELMRSLRVALDRARTKMPSRTPESSSQCTGEGLGTGSVFEPENVQVTVNLRALVQQLRVDLNTGTFSLPMPKPMTSLWVQLQKDPNLSSDQVVRVLEQSPNIARRAISLANTSYYRGTRSITNLKDAVIRLGNRTVVNEAQTLLHREFFEVKNPVFALFFKKLWARTVFLAALVRELVRVQRLGDPENAYLAALFHNVGEIVLLRYIGTSVEPGVVLNADDMEQLQRICSDHHERVGMTLLRSWKFPTECIALAGGHHDRTDRNQSPPKSMSLRRLIHLCNIAEHVADEQGFHSPFESEASVPLSVSLQTLGILEDTLLRAMERTVMLVSTTTQ